MNGHSGAFQIFASKGLAGALLVSGALLLVVSASASGTAWFYTGAEAFSSFPEYTFARVTIAALGIAIVAFKTLLPFTVALFWEQNFVMALMSIGAWLSCLLVCWMSVVFAALEIPAVAVLPERILTVFAVAWLGVEILAGVLPVVGLAALETARDFAPEKFGLNKTDTQYALPGQNDLLGLLVQASGRSQRSRQYAGIEVADDGTIHTSQSVLSHYLGQAESTVHARLRCLQQEGRIALSTSPAGSVAHASFANEPRPFADPRGYPSVLFAPDQWSRVPIRAALNATRPATLHAMDGHFRGQAGGSWPSHRRWAKPAALPTHRHRQSRLRPSKRHLGQLHRSAGADQ
jgi:hypothetical protein